MATRREFGVDIKRHGMRLHLFLKFCKHTEGTLGVKRICFGSSSIFEMILIFGTRITLRFSTQRICHLPHVSGHFYLNLA